LVYDGLENYNKALEYYLRCLDIQEKAKGKGNVDSASTMNNIGSVYVSLCNYSKALEYYERCLEIDEKMKGKDSIDSASTLNNIG